MSLTATVQAAIKVSQLSGLDLGSARADLRSQVSQGFSDGAGAGAVDRCFQDTRTLAASAAESLDLAGGSLSDPLGVALTFARVKAILIKASAGNTNNVQVTRPASNGLPIFMAAGDGISLAPGAAFLWVCPDAAGVVVTAGTGDLLTFTNSAGSTSVSYDIVILGAAS